MGRKVLIIHRHRQIGNLIAGMMEDTGYTVTLISDIYKAQLLALSEPFDLIVIERALMDTAAGARIVERVGRSEGRTPIIPAAPDEAWVSAIEVEPSDELVAVSEGVF